MIKILKKIKKKFKLIELMLTRPVNFSIVHGRNTQVKNIIFFLPDSVYPTGGNIVTHHHADRINELNLGNIQAYILFPNNLDFTYANFVHNSKFKRDLSFDPKTDLYADRQNRPLIGRVGTRTFEILVNQVSEFGAGGFVTRGGRVREVVRDRVDVKLLGGESGSGDK